MEREEPRMVQEKGPSPTPGFQRSGKAALSVCTGGSCLANCLAVQLPNPHVSLHMKVLQRKIVKNYSAIPIFHRFRVRNVKQNPTSRTDASQAAGFDAFTDLAEIQEAFNTQTCLERIPGRSFISENHPRAAKGAANRRSARGGLPV